MSHGGDFVIACPFRDFCHRNPYRYRLTRKILSVTIYIPPFRETPMRKKIDKINPIAKTLRDSLYRKRIVQDKRKGEQVKRAKKEIRDAKTTQDS
jgi:hypothetical protein